MRKSHVIVVTILWPICPLRRSAFLFKHVLYRPPINRSLVGSINCPDVSLKKSLTADIPGHFGNNTGCANTRKQAVGFLLDRDLDCWEDQLQLLLINRWLANGIDV